MSSTAETIQPQASSKPGYDLSLWLRQLRAIIAFDLKKNFFGKRSLLVYLLAAMPVALLMLVVLVNPLGGGHSERLPTIFSVFFNSLILRTIVFFGCAWIFMNLFRGEIVDRSLHYYFLSPVRRELLVTGKYLSGLLTSAILFSSMTVVCMLLAFFPHYYSSSMRFFFEGAGLGHLFWYVTITVLACVGYGAFFIVVGLFVRNPIIPALILYGWEWINFLLPPLLKKISVIHYLNSLVPVPISEGPIAVVAEPTPAWISIPGLLIVTALVLIIAGTRIRRMEVRYGSE
jgi:ABC-type transport system involved in multi-copper enzyme maturation permease subunit